MQSNISVNPHTSHIHHVRTPVDVHNDWIALGVIEIRRTTHRRAERVAIDVDSQNSISAARVSS